MPFVTVDGMAIHYAVETPLNALRGAVVVFVHGAGGTSENWSPQLRHLGLTRNALAVDLPGHGESQGNGYGTIPEYREFLRGFLNALRVPRAALVGHSMGGGIAQSFALVYPDRLEALVLVGTGAKLRIHPDIFTALQRDVGDVARLMSGWAYSKTCMPAVVERGAEAFSRNRAAVLEGDFRACDAFDLMQEIGGIRVPTLILCGAEDALTPVKYARFLYERIPGAAFALLPEAGHMVMLEKPVQFNREVAAFLDTHLGSTA